MVEPNVIPHTYIIAYISWGEETITFININHFHNFAYFGSFNLVLKWQRIAEFKIFNTFYANENREESW